MTRNGHVPITVLIYAGGVGIHKVLFYNVREQGPNEEVAMLSGREVVVSLIEFKFKKKKKKKTAHSLPRTERTSPVMLTKQTQY